MEEVKAKKKPKADRMYQHILDSCAAEGKPAVTCNREANGVVSKWKEAQRRKHSQKESNLTGK